MQQNEVNPGTEDTRASFLLRVLIASLFLVAGIVFVVYAASRHTIPVLIEKEVEVELPPQQIDAIQALAEGLTWEELEELQKPRFVKEKAIVSELRPEYLIVEGVTFAAYERLPSGEIKYIYGIGEDIPEACPT